MSDELDEIWSLFADDGSQSLEIVEETLLRLKETCADAEAISQLFRAVHTFKGNARVLGLEIIEAQAHITEDMIGLVRDDGISLDGEMLALLLEATDCLRGMLEDAVARRCDADPDANVDLVRRMNEKIESCQAGRVTAETDSGFEEACRADELDQELAEADEVTNDAVAGDDGNPSAIIFEPVQASGLGLDPMYQEIFSGMVADVIGEMSRSLDDFEASPQSVAHLVTSELGRLRYAAEQIGLASWSEMLADLQERPIQTVHDGQAWLDRIRDAAARDFPAPGLTEEVGVSQVRQFFDDLEPLLASLSSFGGLVAAQEAFDVDELNRVTGAIQALADGNGMVRVADVAGRLSDSQDGRMFRKLQQQLYEELAAIEEICPEEAKDAKIQPTTVLRSWCADRVFECLLELEEHLDLVKGSNAVFDECATINESMRHLYHACNHYGVKTAAHLAMSLVDLFARVQSGEMSPDPVLLHIARSYVAAMEMVFDTIGSGDAPDMEAIEKLFEEAANVTFAAHGTPSSSAIEARLGLPKSFHKVLTPESCKSAQTALDQGLHFYIVRVDLNRDDAMAEKFLEWVNTGVAVVISNVTVFQDGDTLFDFLLATSVDEVGLDEMLVGLDPTRTILTVEAVLSDRRTVPEAAALKMADQAGALVGADQTQSVSGDMLEAIGEAVASQAAVHHILTSLVEEELSRTVEVEMRKAGIDLGPAQDVLRRVLERFTSRVEQAVQAGTQLNTLLTRLQDEAIAIRTCSADVLLKPLEAFVASLSHKHGRQVDLSVSGSDLVLDQSLLEALKGPIRALLSYCVVDSQEETGDRVAAGKNPQGRLRVSLHRYDDHVAVTIDDDGKGRPSLDDFTEILGSLRGHGGDMRVAHPPMGGASFYLTMPMAMVVLDSMVVRVGPIPYVVSIDAIQRIVHADSEDIIRVSAGDGGEMLRLGKDDLIPVGGVDAAPEKTGRVARKDHFATDEGQRRLFVVVGRLDDKVAVPVDELVGQQVVLVRPLQGYLSSIRGATGCALLAGGEVGMVLDIARVLGQAQQGESKR